MVDCGEPGITKEVCEAKGCCYDESAEKWCFLKSMSQFCNASHC